MSALFPLLLSLEEFGRLRKFSDAFGSLWMCLLSLKSRHSQDKNIMPIARKKLAGIYCTCSDKHDSISPSANC